MVSGKITASPDIAGRSTHLIAGARNANSTLVAGRSDQSHHSHDDSVTDRKGLARLNVGGLVVFFTRSTEVVMGFGRGALLWLLGVPLPIIILLALFMHH
jgi:hypothetical protein